MTTTDQIKQCRTPQEALLVLAAAIDALEAAAALAGDPWEAELDWNDHDTHAAEAIHGPADKRARIIDGEVIVSEVSADRQFNRAEFARKARLAEFWDGLSVDDFVDAYVKGGPRWLVYANRAAVMAMPYGVRQALVADVLLDSPSEAKEIGRDILKIDESTPEHTQVEYARRELT
jgi:hypothetical protein